MELTVTDHEQMIARVEPRSNVFLAALLEMEGGPVPVRVRNLSPRGALIEGAVLPTQGQVQLRRGDLSVCGKLVWIRNGYCGLQFHSTIDVPAWLKRIGHQGQERVDLIVASLRRGTIPRETDPPVNHGPTQIAAALLEIADRLAAMEELSVQAGEQILKIDTLARIIQSWSTWTVSD
jgi:hypothetical protein